MSTKSSSSGIVPTTRRTRIARPSEPDTSFRLLVIEGPDTGASFTLDASSPTRSLVGTSPVCTVRLKDPEISRRHAAIAFMATQVEFIDLGSTNGTTINGVAVKEATLKGGEAIRMGGSVFTLSREDGSAAANVSSSYSFGRLLGTSLAMRRIYPVFELLANTDGPVLIEGESGTGKELLAEEIHRASRRAEGPFLALEASAVPAEEIGACLFGTAQSEGLVQAARGGVLFIDEVGDLPRTVQRRLREVIAEGADVRLIAASRRDLDRDVTSARFDDAFFFTLAAGRVELPPLRDRLEDVQLLALHFWREGAPAGDDPPPELPVDLLPRFEGYTWPGNVRELRAVVVQRATFGELAKSYLSDLARDEGRDLVTALIQEGVPFPSARDRVIMDFERRYVETVLARHNGSVAAAARASGVAHRYFQLVRARVR